MPYATEAAIANRSSNYSEERQGNASDEKRHSQREFKNGQSFGEPVSFEEQGSARARVGNSTMGRLMSQQISNIDQLPINSLTNLSQTSINNGHDNPHRKNTQHTQPADNKPKTRGNFSVQENQNNYTVHKSKFFQQNSENEITDSGVKISDQIENRNFLGNSQQHNNFARSDQFVDEKKKESSSINGFHGSNKQVEQKSGEVDFGIEDDILCDVQMKSSSSSCSAESTSKLDKET